MYNEKDLIAAYKKGYTDKRRLYLIQGFIFLLVAVLSLYAFKVIVELATPPIEKTQYVHIPCPTGEEKIQIDPDQVRLL